MKKILLTAVTALYIILYSCSKSSEDTYTDPDPPGGGGNNSCDTTSIQYEADILPIIQSNCYGCHSEESSASGMGIVLEGHANLKAKADAGILLGVINHSSGFPAMPKDGAKLSQCNINKITAWVNGGAKDD